TPAAAPASTPAPAPAGRRARDPRRARLPARAGAPGTPRGGRRRAGPARSDTRRPGGRPPWPRPAAAPPPRSTVLGAQRAALPVPLEGQVHELAQQIVVLDPARVPELGEHADGGEAGNGVDLVDVHLPRLALHQEVHARVAARVHGLEAAHAQLLRLA